MLRVKLQQGTLLFKRSNVKKIKTLSKKDPRFHLDLVGSLDKDTVVRLLDPESSTPSPFHAVSIRQQKYLICKVMVCA